MIVLYDLSKSCMSFEWFQPHSTNGLLERDFSKMQAQFQISQRQPYSQQQLFVEAMS